MFNKKLCIQIDRISVMLMLKIKIRMYKMIVFVGNDSRNIFTH